MVQLKAGARLKCVVCSTQLIVIASTEDDISLTCGGVPMVDVDAPIPAGETHKDAKDGTLIGKRYESVDGTLEVLCTKSGEGSLALGEMSLQLKSAKPLPASD